MCLEVTELNDKLLVIVRGKMNLNALNDGDKPWGVLIGDGKGGEGFIKWVEEGREEGELEGLLARWKYVFGRWVDVGDSIGFE